MSLWVLSLDYFHWAKMHNHDHNLGFCDEVFVYVNTTTCMYINSIYQDVSYKDTFTWLLYFWWFACLAFLKQKQKYTSRRKLQTLLPAKANFIHSRFWSWSRDGCSFKSESSFISEMEINDIERKTRKKKRLSLRQHKKVYSNFTFVTDCGLLVCVSGC